jgi:predicted N-acetyltransferase YhbS
MVRVMDMLVKLYELPDSRDLVSRLAADGVSIRRALPPEKHKILAWVRSNFSEAWASETDVAFARQPVSCFVAIKDKHLVGFACHDATCLNFFGPTGVDPLARGKGIGAALLFACLEAMRHQGFGYAIIGGVGPADFYTKTVGAIPIAGSQPGIYRGLL